ncbi:hypothetical protein GE278_23860 (plasmid) [Enterobacteriaceae bacterium Kacie_13]|nr:hypothetical protein GE278_23860 [Enterobacteriaceae bacterium Kacie_13]
MFFKTLAFLILLLGIFPVFFASATFVQPCMETFCYMKTEVIFLDHNEIRERILTEFYQWEGVKYKLGGVNDAGIDCSALMQEIFNNALEMELPRTTSEQIQKGRSVSIGQLKPGDLVFFHTKKTVRHVGVYVGKKKFVHASSSKGVTVSSLDNNYWIEHFEAARRVLS